MTLQKQLNMYILSALNSMDGFLDFVKLERQSADDRTDIR